MAVGGIVELFLGVRAEQQPLEDIAKPITAARRRTGAAKEEPDAGTERGARPSAATATRASASGRGCAASGPGPAPAPTRRSCRRIPPSSPAVARPRDRDHRPRPAGARRAQPGASSPSESAPATGARVASVRRCARRCVRAGPSRVGRERYASTGRRRRLRPRGADRGRSAARLLGHRVRFWAEGSTHALGVRARMRSRGRNRYASAADARRYARAFECRDSDDLGRRPTLSLLPLWLGRRGNRR